MEIINELMLSVSAYRPALLALTLLCLAVLVQGFLAGILGFSKGAEVPGMPLRGSHKDLSFRCLRTYANSVENLPVFATIVLLAVIAGATPNWVNWLAIGHLVVRLLYWMVYYSGTGKAGGGPRSFVYVVGWLFNFGLAIVTLLAFLKT